MTLDEMKHELYVLNVEQERISSQRQKLEQQIAAAVAESIGLAIGATVRVSCNVGWGNKRKSVVRRYKVTAILFSSYKERGLRLIGNTLRKDGTLGGKHDIDSDWELERG